MRAKITDKKVESMKRLRAFGKSYHKIARECECSPEAVMFHLNARYRRNRRRYERTASRLRSRKVWQLRRANVQAPEEPCFPTPQNINSRENDSRGD